MEFGKGTGRKYEKPHPEWKEGDIMPVETVPMEDIVKMDDQLCYERIEKYHNIGRHEIFEHAVSGKRWTESSLLRAILGRLEGHGYLEIVYELMDGGMLPATNSSVEREASVLKGRLVNVCRPNVYQKMRYNSASYQSTTYALREISQEKIGTILNALALQREDLFVDEKALLGRTGGAITTTDLIRALELRVKQVPWEEVVSRLVSEGNIDLGKMDTEKAVKLLQVYFSRFLSIKARTALIELLAKNR